MKIKPGFEVQTVCGEHILMAMGEENIDFSKVIALNETSCFIWEKMKSGIVNVDELVAAVTNEYDIDNATAKADIEALINQFVELGVMEA